MFKDFIIFGCLILLGAFVLFHVSDHTQTLIKTRTEDCMYLRPDLGEKYCMEYATYRINQ